VSILILNIIITVEIKRQLDATDDYLLHLVGVLFPHINDDARSKPHQIIITIVTYHFLICMSQF